jgi:hypothetical protein
MENSWTFERLMRNNLYAAIFLVGYIVFPYIIYRSPSPDKIGAFHNHYFELLLLSCFMLAMYPIRAVVRERKKAAAKAEAVENGRKEKQPPSEAPVLASQRLPRNSLLLTAAILGILLAIASLIGVIRIFALHDYSGSYYVMCQWGFLAGGCIALLLSILILIQRRRNAEKC